MPVTKPSTLPRWANVGGSVVEPTEGKKDVGWATQEKPPAQYWNWLLYTIYLWINWLNDITNQAFTWVGAQTFSAASTFNALVTATAGITSNFLTTSETGVRHADREYHFGVAGTWVGGTQSQIGNIIYWKSSGAFATDKLFVEIMVPAGERIKTFFFSVNGDASGTISMKLWKQATSGVPRTAAVQLGSTIGKTFVALDNTNLYIVSGTLGTPEVIAVGYRYVLEVTGSAQFMNCFDTGITSDKV
jgi:hypothetical protein